MDFYSIVYSIAGLIAILVSCVVSLVKSRKEKFNVLKDHGIPGPKPNIIFGNYSELALQHWFKREVDLFVLQKWHQIYGRVFGYYVGPKPRILITDQDVLRQVFIKEIGVFTNRPETGLRNSRSLLDLRDDRWRYVRRILTPTFSAGKLKQMNVTMNSCVNTLCEMIKKKSDRTEDIEAYTMLQLLTMEVILRCALALDMDCQKKEYGLVNALKEIFKFSLDLRFLFITALPWMRNLLVLFPRLSSRFQGLPYIMSNLAQVYEQRKMMKGEKFNDVLQLLMEAAEGKHEEELKMKRQQQKELSANKNSDSESMEEVPMKLPDDGVAAKLAEKGQALLTVKEILDNALVFLLAGFETTSNALGYSVYLLAKHQDIQDKARDEVDEVLGDKDEITYEDVSKMAYVEQVLLESMRLFPPVVSFVTRMCKKTTKVNGWTFPEGCMVEAPVWLLHHDPEYWSEPEKFDPDRFGPENRSVRHQMSFCPFGIGPRKCIGERFAMFQAKLCLAKLLQKFKFSLSERSEDSLSTVVLIAGMKPRNGIWVTAALR